MFLWFVFQECLEKFLQGTGGLQNRELLMVHYLQQANYIPALQLNHSLKRNLVVCLCVKLFHKLSQLYFDVQYVIFIINYNASHQLKCSFKFLTPRMRETQSLKNGRIQGTLYWISMAKFCQEFKGNWRWREQNHTSIRTPSTENVRSC